MKMKMTTLTRTLVGTLLLSLLSGCGFQLRGSSQALSNIDALSISSGNRYGPLGRALEQEMRIQHIADGGDRAWQLHILEEELEENVVAFSDTNNPASEEIELVVRFRVINGEGREVIAANTERVVRLYEVNTNRRLAMDSETTLLKEEAYRDMAQNLLRRIDFIAGQPQLPATTATATATGQP